MEFGMCAYADVGGVLGCDAIFKTKKKSEKVQTCFRSADEISEVVPWIELAHDYGVDLHTPQVTAPRVFKTHCWYDHVPKGGKYIVVVREPTDVAVSFFRFFEGWFFAPGEISLDVRTHPLLYYLFFRWKTQLIAVPGVCARILAQTRGSADADAERKLLPPRAFMVGASP
jgi:hypothetical protein